MAERAKRNPEYRTNIEAADCGEILLAAFRWLWKTEGAPESILCIGTDRATGDAFGPLIGTELMGGKRLPCPVFGTLDRPLHASNLAQLLGEHPRLASARCLAIDASLGRVDEVGTLTVGVGALHPGAGVHKNLPAVGYYYATGTVNIGGFMDYFVLQNTRLALVMRMAHTVSKALGDSLAL